MTLADINKIMVEVQKDVHYHIPIAHADIISSKTGVSQYLRAPLIPWNSSPRSPTDLRLLLKPSVDQSFLTDEREARAAAYLFWVVLQPVLLSSELNEIMQNTVVALKREGKQTFSSLAAGQQGALQFALQPLQNMFSRALVKSFAVKHRLRLAVLGNLRPFALFDKILSSSLLCPGLFPDSSWAEASNLLRQAMDSPALRAWDGKVPSFNPSPSSRPRPFRAALPPPRASWWPLLSGLVFPHLLLVQSVNFGRHLTEILYPFEISYQIFIHTLPYQYLSFRNFTLPKFSFEKSYLTKLFFSEMLRNFTIIKVSVPHPALGVLKVRPTAPPAAPTGGTSTMPASPGAVVAAPLGASLPTPPLQAVLPAKPPTHAAVLGAATIPVANITTIPLTTTPGPEVVPAPPPAIEAGSPAAPSRSGGRLTLFAPTWVAAPPSIQTIVRRDFHWTWLDRPSRLRPPRYSQSRPDLLLPVQDWVAKGVVYPVPHQPCFQSRIFTVP